MFEELEGIELLPCPFCGATPTQPSCFSTGENDDGYVCCNNCHAVAPQVELDEIVEDEETQAQWHINAAAAWNKRSPFRCEDARMTFDEWMKSVRSTYRPTDDSSECRMLRRCWNAARTNDEDQTDMAYVAEDPSQPGAAWAICVDDPQYKDDTSRCVSEWVKEGAIVKRVTLAAGCDMIDKWVRPNKQAQ
jgi:hypothetical protein